MSNKLKPAQDKRSLSRAQILADTSGQRLLIGFCESIEAGELPSDNTLRLIAMSFRKILNGQNAEKALNLTLPKGHPHTTFAQQGRQIGLVIEVLNRRDAGATKQAAITAVASAYYVGEEALRTWCRKHAHMAKALRDYVEAIKAKRKKG